MRFADDPTERPSPSVDHRPLKTYWANDWANKAIFGPPDAAIIAGVEVKTCPFAGISSMGTAGFEPATSRV